MYGLQMISLPREIQNTDRQRVLESDCITERLHPCCNVDSVAKSAGKTLISLERCCQYDHQRHRYEPGRFLPVRRAMQGSTQSHLHRPRDFGSNRWQSQSRCDRSLNGIGVDASMRSRPRQYHRHKCLARIGRRAAHPYVYLWGQKVEVFLYGQRPEDTGSGHRQALGIDRALVGRSSGSETPVLIGVPMDNAPGVTKIMDIAFVVQIRGTISSTR